MAKLTADLLLSIYEEGKKEKQAFLAESAEIDALDDDTKTAFDREIIEIAKNNTYDSNSYGYYGRHLSDEWYRSADKMKDYKAKGSDPKRIASACKDFQKVCCRLIWAQSNWPEAVEAFKERAKDMYYENNKSRVEYLGRVEKEERLAREEKERQFEEDVQNTDTTTYAPVPRDWDKMIDYRNRKSNAERVAQSCKDNNKIVARYIIAKLIGWKEAEEAFKNRIKSLNILTDAELEAYTRKVAEESVPEQYQALIDDLVMNDLKGGFAKAVDTSDDKSASLPDKYIKALDNNFNIESYTAKRQAASFKSWSNRDGYYQTKHATEYIVDIKLVNGKETSVSIYFRNNNWYWANDPHSPMSVDGLIELTNLRIQKEL